MTFEWIAVPVNFYRFLSHFLLIMALLTLLYIVKSPLD